jgi:hypothetical protein
MKRMMWAVLGGGLLVGMGFWVARRPAVPAPVAESAGAAVAATDPGSPAPAVVVAAPARLPDRPKPALPEPKPAAAPRPGSLDNATLVQMVDWLVSPRAPHEQKEAAWKRLRETGQLDQAISELEQRMASEARPAEYAAALGQGYLKKCAVLQDVREQGILAMQADKLFDAALNLDPANWEARFTKAVALSYWPASMNKGDEVIQHFRTLIQQQEAEAAQPHFAESYLWLGDQYQKAGQGDYAQTVWQRGAAWFPAHDGLKNRLAAAGDGQPATAGVGQ